MNIDTNNNIISYIIIWSLKGKISWEIRFLCFDVGRVLKKKLMDDDEDFEGLNISSCHVEVGSECDMGFHAA